MILSRALASGGGKTTEMVQLAAQPGPQDVADAGRAGLAQGPVYLYRNTPGSQTVSGKVVTPESARGVATAYRAANLISDTIAMMPLQKFKQVNDQKVRVRPNARLKNDPYLVEICPNRWGWTPFQFKKSWVQWLVFYGNAFVWSPAVFPFEKFLLSSEVTFPVFDEAGELWYSTRFANGKQDFLPSAEVLHTLINPDESGQFGRGVIEYARESVGRQMGAYDTESKLFKQGLTPAAYIQVAATLDDKGRKAYRDSYGEVMSGGFDGTRLAVFDQRITKFEPITMKLVDAQFLELIGATDRDIANFFGMPLHMLNMGKEAYSSNEQKYMEFLSATIDPFLVQMEQGARVKWLSEGQQADYFWKFNRDALLRMDGKSRAEMGEILIRSGQRSPNEVRDKDDYSAYLEGDNFYMTKNYADVSADAQQTGDVNNGKI